MCSRADFFPSRLNLKVWWALFWRTTLFALPLLLVGGMLLDLAQVAWAKRDFAGFLRFVVWRDGHVFGWFVAGQLAKALFGILPGMILAWYMLLSAPVYRTFTLRHIRNGELAHGFKGAVRLGWSTFWRLMVNLTPLYIAVFGLLWYHLQLGRTQLSGVPQFMQIMLFLTLPSLYLYPLTIHHVLKDKHRRWSLAARGHKHEELLEAFLPTGK